MKLAFCVALLGCLALASGSRMPSDMGWDAAMDVSLQALLFGVLLMMLHVRALRTHMHVRDLQRMRMPCSDAHRHNVHC